MKITPIAAVLFLTGCGTLGNAVRTFDEPSVSKPTLKVEAELPEPSTGAIAIAVYNFRDMTGQRKSSQNIASLSSAVTQGADAYLVKSLQEAGGGRWFKVLERGGLDNLIKERQLIRQMRELYQGKDAQQLPPMMFAGVLIEGGIIGYDSNTMSGGSGARILGIGTSTQYQQDEVTVSLRVVSVATGEVLVTVNTTKKVFSFMDKAGVLRFYDAGTRALELETGSATNESMNRAVQLAIHAAVIEMIKEGARKGHWSFKTDTSQTQKPQLEQKVDEKKDDSVKKDITSTENKSSEAKPIEPEPVKTNAVDGSGNPILASVQTEIKKGKVVDWVNIRLTKDQNSEKLINLKPGVEVEVLEDDGQHLRIRADGKEGYVLRKFIAVQ